MENKEIKWVFIIDTNQYAGNFERDMCAYCTGQIGDCKVGEEESEKFEIKYGQEFINEMSEIIENRPDEHGCHRPTKIHPTPGYLNNGMGKEYKEKEWKEGMEKYPSYQSVAIFFYDKPKKDIIEMIKKRAKEFTKKQKIIKIIGFRLKKEIKTEEYIKIF
jgi:hypothetical protein